MVVDSCKQNHNSLSINVSQVLISDAIVFVIFVIGFWYPYNVFVSFKCDQPLAFG